MRFLIEERWTEFHSRRFIIQANSEAVAIAMVEGGTEDLHELDEDSFDSDKIETLVVGRDPEVNEILSRLTDVVVNTKSS